jgi:hypothetical protein
VCVQIRQEIAAAAKIELLKYNMARAGLALKA